MILVLETLIIVKLQIIIFKLSDLFYREIVSPNYY